MRANLASKNTPAKDTKSNVALDSLCIELQYAFVAPSEQLLSANYLNLKQSPSASTGYRVPSLIFEKSKLLLRPSTYKEIIEERSALKLCGLPTCGTKLKSVPTNKTYYRLNLHKKEIFEEKDSYFCCKECCAKSMEFESNLEDVAVQFKSHTLEQIKQALQIIFSWYRGKIAVNIDIKLPSKPSPEPNHKIKEITKKIKGLKIREKNVAHNLHQTVSGDDDKANKRKWKRAESLRANNNRSSIRMEVDDDECKGNDDDDDDIPMTTMEQLFRIQREEKLRIEREAKLQKQNQSKDNCETEKVYESVNGRTVKRNDDLNEETLQKIEAEKERIVKEEKHRRLYDSMSDNAQLMGHYISWCTDFTTFYVMNDENGYVLWKQKAMNEYRDMYNDPILKQRQLSLRNNVSKYVMGLLTKFNVNVALTSTVCNELQALIETFDISSAIPSFTAKTWCFVAFVFLKLISNRFGQLKREMFDKTEVAKKVLDTIGFGEEYVTTLEQIVVFD